MKFLKFIVSMLTIFTVFVLCYGYLYDFEVIDILKDFIVRKPTEIVYNEYTKDPDISFVHLTDNFVPNSYDDLLSIFYTVLSSGMKEFKFYCPAEYTTCIEDVKNLSNSSETLAEINSFVHMYNNFKKIKVEYIGYGKVTIYVNKFYDDEQISIINKKVDEIYNKIIDESKSERENIKAIHDYIINNTKYGSNEEDESSPAYQVFFNGIATCKGYTDAATLLLDKLGIENTRIVNESHTWNAVKYNDEWLHLDLTWDDPTNAKNADILTYDYFLKTNSEVDATDTSEQKHTFDRTIYSFMK